MVYSYSMPESAQLFSEKICNAKFKYPSPTLESK